jgi:hypothetical protein
MIVKKILYDYPISINESLEEAPYVASQSTHSLPSRKEYDGK